MRFAIPTVLAATTLLASPALAQDDFYVPTNEDGFVAVAASGLGDPANSSATAMQWFKGDLYVGTSRSSSCVTLATLASQLPVNLYPFIGPNCPADPTKLLLAAEIWRYRPASGQWDRVYQSPVDVPVRDLLGRPKFTARDIAFRSMAVVKESGGQETLYVGGMSAAEVFPKDFAAMANPPGPRLLRTRTGDLGSWEAVPQTPGTFLGDLGKGLPGSAVKPVVFDALVGYRGRLFAAAGDFFGNNAILASTDPASGDDAWKLASPLPEAFPVSALAVYNDFLYCAVAGRQGQPYRIFKADAASAAPLDFSLVLTGGSTEPGAATSLRAMSLAEFRGRLFVGTGTPPELVRIDADDTWELLIGQPRMTEDGLSTASTSSAATTGSRGRTSRATASPPTASRSPARSSPHPPVSSSAAPARWRACRCGRRPPRPRPRPGPACRSGSRR